jgi:asparagine synthase (glutamine-hydrolysing)
MTHALTHRGPDDAGFHVEDDAGLGLGFRRLAIIDLSPDGNQPMTNEDGTLWLVFNGEIYNFKELRRDLESGGHVFRSHTDTEVILHGYERWGADVVQHLDGMYAFALWDRARRTLLLARDRYGIKPLHYAFTPHGIIFASEIKALTEHEAIDHSVDLDALWQFLSLGQIPAPRTIYRQIAKLRPGHRIICRGDPASVEPFYRLPAVQPQSAPAEEDAERLRELLTASVRRHLVADVPVGCLLSGGLDSSVVAAMAAQEGGKLQTFSVSFPGSAPEDESSYQRLMADFLGSDHHVLEATPDLGREMRALPGLTDEPFAISSFFPLYHVSRMAASRVKVVLSGDGSDELFAGYASRYVEDSRRLWLRHAARAWPMPRTASAIWHNRTAGGRIRRRAHLAGLPEPERYVTANSYFSSEEKAALIQPDVLRAITHRAGEFLAHCFPAQIADPVRRRMHYEMRVCLPDEMLTKVDRATSAVSIEGRVPYLDGSVVDFAWSRPTATHLRGRQGKQLLRRVARGLVPDAVIQRRKQGFAMPLDRWLSADHSALREIALSDVPAMDSVIRPEAVKAMLEAHDRGWGSHGARLWVLCVLKLWFAQSHE